MKQRAPLPKRTATKRLTRSGHYRFYDLRGKRISKQSYYSRLSRFHQRLKEVQPRAPRKRQTVKKTSYDGKFTRGFNYSKRLDIWLDEFTDNLDSIIDRVRVFYLDCRKRFKLLTFCYFNFKAKIFISSGNEEEFFINTRVSFPSQYDDTAFFNWQVREALESFLKMISDPTHSGEWEEIAEKVHLVKVGLHSREDKSFKIERRG